MAVKADPHLSNKEIPCLMIRLSNYQSIQSTLFMRPERAEAPAKLPLRPEPPQGSVTEVLPWLEGLPVGLFCDVALSRAACAWWHRHFVLNYVAAEMTRDSGVLPRGVTTFPYQHKHGVSLPAKSSPPPPPSPPLHPGLFLLRSIPPPAPRRHTHCPHGYKHFIEHVAALRSSQPFPALPLAWRL